MERKVAGLFIYKSLEPFCYRVIDYRPQSPTWGAEWGVLPRTFNIWQNIGQLKIFFLAHGDEQRWLPKPNN
jgi:hypothetical protein